MSEISSETPKRPIPEPHSGIEVNFCKTPGCQNFGVPPSQEAQPKGRPTAATRAKRDGYVVVGVGGTRLNVPGLRCQHCNTSTTLKSNQGVYEELTRLSSYLNLPAGHGCRKPECANHGKSVERHADLYGEHGKTKSGSSRYRCKACGTTFSVGKSTLRQRLPHKNRLIFSLLMNHEPLNRICEVAEVNISTLYAKIDFLYRQCRAFAASRERALAHTEFERLYRCTDRQEYVINWGDRKQRKTIRASAVGTADLRSKYVFALSPNVDPSLDPEKVEEEAKKAGDYAVAPPFRRFARLWLKWDYLSSVERAATAAAEANRTVADDLDAEIERRAKEMAARDDLDATELLTKEEALPAKGMQVHADYTMYGHFQFLRLLLGRTKKLRFFLDQDAGMKQACFAAFHDAIDNRWADVFFVATVKDWTVDQKRQAVTAAKAALTKQMKERPELSEKELRVSVMQERIEAALASSPLPKQRLNGVWLAHPFPDMAAPEKRVCYLTDYDDYDTAHLAHLYNMASLHGIDSVFEQLRRRVRLFERGLPTARRSRRIWIGYAPYTADTVLKMLEIFRVWHNWVFVGIDGNTAAERLGIARGKTRMEDIIYFAPQA